MITTLLALAALLAPEVRTVEGPVVLRSRVEMLWGGHTFDYVIEGERAIYWTGTDFRPGDDVEVALVGQYPKPGSDVPPLVTEIVFDAPDVTRVNAPQAVRTPDGHLHVFVGYRGGEHDHGQTRYLRTARPGDVSELVDRTELVPFDARPAYAARQNVGISRDGRRMVIQTLTRFVDGVQLQNEPLVFVGRREGADFVFDEPVQWSDPLAFFYPQVAVTDHGIVMLGAVSDAEDTRRFGVLVHLDHDGRELLRRDLPHPERPGRYWAYELTPVDPDDWSRLAIVATRAPEEGTVRQLQFWEYDAEERALHLRRTVENDFATDESVTNAGRWLPVSETRSLFVNNPHLDRLCVWDGDLLGDGPYTFGPLERGDVKALGYERSRHVLVPDVLSGSVRPGRFRYVAADVNQRLLERGASGPCSLLLWRIEIR